MSWGKGSVSRLVVAVTALCAVISLVSAIVMVAYGIRTPVRIVIGDAVEGLMASPAGAACRAAGGWRAPLDGGDAVGFFDRDRLDEAPIPPAARASLRAEGAYMGPGTAGRRLFALVVDETGPCSVYTHQWAPRWRFRRFFLVGVPALIAGAAALAALLGAWLIARPLRRRVDRLAAAAGRMARADYPGADVGGGDELARVGRALDDAHARLRADHQVLLAQKQAVEDDLSALAHDTNTPLTALFMALEHLSEADDLGEARAQAEAALGDVIYLSSLVQNLALDRRLAGDQPLPEQAATDFDLGEVAERVARRAERLARPRAVAVDISRPDGPVPVHGHPTLVEQALMNVAQNAVAAVPDGGQVLVVLEPAAGGTEFCLWIGDDGPGLAEDEVAHALERGWRGAAARAARPNGTGLGLATAAAVCARHGWRLALVGHGTLGGLEARMSGPRIG